MSEIVEISPNVLRDLHKVTAATVNMQLLKRGIRNSWIAGPKPLWQGLPRIVGEAFTFRFVPMREDLATLESYAGPRSIREAIESVPAGKLVVIDARGEQGAATLGDILAARLKARGCMGVISDGPMRDVEAVREVGLPMFCTGSAAPPSITKLLFAGWQEVIGCGGVAIRPDDIVVADEDGAVAVPRELAAEVARDGLEQERFERYAQMLVAKGSPVKGVYPPSDETRANYEAWVADGEPGL